MHLLCFFFFSLLTFALIHSGVSDAPPGSSMPATSYAIHHNGPASGSSIDNSAAHEINQVEPAAHASKSDAAVPAANRKTTTANHRKLVAAQRARLLKLDQRGDASPPRLMEPDGTLAQVTPNASAAAAPSSSVASSAAVSTTAADQFLNSTSNQASSDPNRGEARETALPASHLYIDINALRRHNQQVDLTKKSQQLSSTENSDTVPIDGNGDNTNHDVIGNRDSCATQQRTPQSLQVRQIAALRAESTASPSQPAPPTAHTPHGNTGKLSSGSSSSSPPSSQAADMARTQVYHSPHIFNRHGRTQVISAHSSSSSTGSSTDSLTIHLNTRKPPAFTPASSPSQGCDQDKQQAEEPADNTQTDDRSSATAMTATAAAVMEASAKEPSLVTPPDMGTRSGPASRRSLLGPRAATSSPDSQPPPLTDMTHAPDSQMGSSWDNSLTDTMDSFEASAHRNNTSNCNTNGGGDGQARAEGGRLPQQQGNDNVMDEAGSLNRHSGPSFSASSVTRSTRRGAGQGRHTRLGWSHDGAGSGASAGSSRSVKTAAFYDQDLSANSVATTTTTATTKTTAASVVRADRNAAARPANATADTSRRAVPSAYIRRMRHPAPSAKWSSSSSSSDREDLANVSPSSCEPSPRFASSSPPRPSSAERKALAQPSAGLTPATSASRHHVSPTATVHSNNNSNSDTKGSELSSAPVPVSAQPQKVTAPSSRPQRSRADTPPLNSSDHLSVSEGSPLKSKASPPPPQQQQQHELEPPPTTCAPMSLSASRRSREVLFSLDGPPSAIQQHDIGAPANGATHVRASALASPSPSPFSPVNSSHPLPSGHLSAHPSADAHAPHHSSSPEAAALTTTTTTTGQPPPGPLVFADLSRVGHSPLLPHTMPLIKVDVSNNEAASQHSQLNREGEISAPYLANMLDLPILHDSHGDPLFTSPLGTRMGSDSASDYYACRYSAKFTAAPQLVPEASQEFFVRCAQRMGGNGNNRAANTDNTSNGDGDAFPAGLPLVRGHKAAAATTLPAPLTRGNTVTEPAAAAISGQQQQQQRTAAVRQIMLDNDEANGNNSSPSEHHFDIRSTSSAPHPLMALMLDAQKLPMPTAEDTKTKVERTSMAEGRPDKRSNDNNSSRSSSCCSRKTVETQASVRDERVPLSLNHSVDEEGNLIIYKPPPAVAAAPDVAEEEKSLMTAEGRLRAAVPPSISHSRNSSDYRGGSHTLAVVAPGEETLVSPQPFSSSTLLATDLVPGLHALPSGTDMSGGSMPSSSGPVRSPQPLAKPSQSSSDATSLSPASPPAAHGAAPLARDCHRYNSLSASPVPYVMRLAPPLSPATMTATSTTTNTTIVATTINVANNSNNTAVTTLCESPTSSSQPSRAQVSSTVSGHSIALISAVTSSEWSALLPPPPPAPPLRLFDLHTQGQLPPPSPRRPGNGADNAEKAERAGEEKSAAFTAREEKEAEDEGRQEVETRSPVPAPPVEKAIMTMPDGHAPAQEGKTEEGPPSREQVAVTAAAAQDSAKADTTSTKPPPPRRILRTKLRARSVKGKGKLRRAKPRPAQLPPPVPVRHTISGKVAPPPSQDAASPMSVAAAAAAAAPAAKTERSSSLGSTAAATTPRTASLLCPPQTVDTSLSVPRQSNVSAKTAILTHTDINIDTDDNINANNAPSSSAAGATPPPPLDTVAVITGAAKTVETVEGVGVTVEAAPASQSPSTTTSQHMSLTQASRRLAVRKMLAGERISQDASTTAARSAEVATTTLVTAVITTSPKKETAQEKTAATCSSRVQKKQLASASLHPPPPSSKLPTQQQQRPQRDVTIITARERLSPTQICPSTSPKAAAAVAATPFTTTTTSPFPSWRGRRRFESSRVEELPPSPSVSAVSSESSPKQAALEKDYVKPCALLFHHTQNKNSAEGSGTGPRHTTVSPAPLAACEVSQGGVDTTSSASSTPSPSRTPVLPPSAAVTATEEVNAAPYQRCLPPAPAPVFTADRRSSTAVSASPYARAPTYNRPQEIPFADNVVRESMRSQPEEAGDRAAALVGAVGRSPLRRATRLASTASAKKTPRGSRTSWSVRETQLMSTPGTDFAPSIIPATTCTVDSRASTSETSALMHALGAWTPVQVHGSPQEEQQQQQEEEVANWAELATEAAPAADPMVHRQSSPPPLPSLMRHTKKRMRRERTGIAAARLRPAGAPLTRRLSTPSSVQDRAAVQSQPQSQRRLHDAATSRGDPGIRESELDVATEDIEQVAVSSAGMNEEAATTHRTPSSIPQQQQQQQPAESSVRPTRRTDTATSPLQCRPSPSSSSPYASKSQSRVESASPVARALVNHTNPFHESSPPPTPTTPHAHHPSVGSQTHPTPVPRTVLLAPSPHRAATASASHTAHKSTAASPPVRPLGPSQLVSPFRNRQSTSPVPQPHQRQQRRRPSPSSLAQSAHGNTAQPILQPSPPTTPQCARPTADSHARDFFVTPPTKFFGHMSPDSSRGTREGEVVRESLLNAEMANSRSLHGSPRSSQQSSVPSSCLQVRQRQAGCRSHLPRTLPSLALTPDPVATAGFNSVPAALLLQRSRPRSVEPAKEGRNGPQLTGSDVNNNNNNGRGGGGAFNKLGALGQKLIPLWWRKDRRTGSNSSSRRLNQTAESVPLSSQHEQVPTPNERDVPRVAHAQLNTPQTRRRSPPRAVTQPRTTRAASPRRDGRSGDFLYAVERTPALHDGTDYYDSCPVDKKSSPEQLQQQQPQRRSSAAGSISPTPLFPERKGNPTRQQPPPPQPSYYTTSPSPLLATPPELKLSTQPPISAAHGSVGAWPSFMAMAGQPLQNLPCASIAAVSASAGSLLSAQNYYGAYQRSLHRGGGSGTPVSRTSHSPLPWQASPSHPCTTQQSLSRTRVSQPQPHPPSSSPTPLKPLGVNCYSMKHDADHILRESADGSSVSTALSLLQPKTLNTVGAFLSSAGASRVTRNVPFYGIRPRKQQSSPNSRSDLPRSASQDEPTRANDGGAATRAPRLTRALLDTFQQAQTDANTSPTPSPKPPYEAQRQQQQRTYYTASQAYFTNPRYAEQQARAQATHTDADQGVVLVEEITPSRSSSYRPVLSAPSCGRGRPGPSPPRPSEILGRVSNASRNHAYQYRTQRTTTTASHVPESAGAHSFSPAAASPVFFSSSYDTQAHPAQQQHRAVYSTSPVPVAPNYTMEPLTGQKSASPVLPVPHQASSTTATTIRGTLANLSRPAGRRTQYPTQRFVLHPQPQPHGDAPLASSYSSRAVDALRYAEAADVSSFNEGRHNSGHAGQNAPVTRPLLPQLQPSGQVGRGTMAGTVFMRLSSPKASSMQGLQEQEEREEVTMQGEAERGQPPQQRASSLLRGLRMQKEQRQGRRASMGR